MDMAWNSADVLKRKYLNMRYIEKISTNFAMIYYHE